MVCTGIEIVGSSGWAGLMVFPATCNPYFWLIILGALFIIFTMSFVWRDQERQYGKADITSAAGVSSVVIIFLASILTLVHVTINGEEVAALSQTMFLYVLAFSTVFIGIWFFKR